MSQITEKKIFEYTKNIESGIDLIESYYERGKAYYEIYEYSLAIDDLKICIQLNPKHVDAYLGIGASYDNIKEYDLAIESFNKCIELDPELINAYYNRGNVYYNKKQYDLAIENFNKCIEIDCEFIDAYYNRGCVYYDKIEYYLAIESYRECIELDSEYLKACYNIAMAYTKILEYDLAIKSYSKCIELEPKFLDAYYNRGSLYYDKKEYGLAIKDYNKCIELDSEFINPYNERGTAYVDTKKYDLAIKDFNRLLELDSKNYLGYYNRGGAYYCRQEYDLAIEDYNKCIELNPNDPDAYNGKGNAYSGKRDYELAILTYNKCIELDSEYNIAYKNLGNLYSEIAEFELMGLNYDLYLYYSYKSKSFDLGKGIVDYWSNKPYNFVFISDFFGIDYTDYGLNYYKSIKDIEDYNSFLTKFNNNQHLKESTRAILNYYLGSTVTSFIHYDEVLDLEYYPLYSQELFYYALTSEQIQVDSKEVLIDCIDELSNYQNYSLIDLYYLGQLYYLNNNQTEAYNCFSDSIGFTPSLIMLLSLEEDETKKHVLYQQVLNSDEAKIFLTGIKRQSISIGNTFEGQFQNYFHSRELLTAVEKIRQKFKLPETKERYINLELWETFYFTNKEREKLYLTLREFEMNDLVKLIVAEIDTELKHIEDDDVLNYLINIENSLKNDQEDKEVEAFKSLLTSEKNNEDVENHIGRLITSFNLAHPKLYLYFISYFSLNQSINSHQAFVLYNYLVNTICEKKSTNIKSALKTIVPEEISKMFLLSIGLSDSLFGISNVIKACEILMQDFDSYELQDETQYMNFKRNFWKYISINKELMSEAKFKTKFQCFSAIVEHNLENI